MSYIFCGGISPYWIAVATLWNILQFLLLRIGDDYKDQKTDNQLYKTRPIQSKVVTFKSLKYLYLGLLLVYIFLSKEILLEKYFWLSMLVFFGGYFLIFKDYFIPNLRKNFLLYNFLSAINIPLIVFATYLIWYSNWPTLNFTLLLKHFLVAALGSLLLELVRKGDRKTEDGYLQHMPLHAYIGLVCACNLIMSLALGFWGSLAALPILFLNYYLATNSSWRLFKLANFTYYLTIYISLLYAIYNGI
ncbi:MAG: hypothetical protein WCK98_04375 [bacterium]